MYLPYIAIEWNNIPGRSLSRYSIIYKLSNVVLYCLFIELPNLIQAIKDNVKINISTSQSGKGKMNAIDGNTSYFPDSCSCCSATQSNDPQPYWQIDLGKQYLVSIIEVISRADIEFADADRTIQRQGTLYSTSNIYIYIYIIITQYCLKCGSFYPNN